MEIRSLRQRANAVFLDRDGTLNVDSGYPSSLAEIELLPGAIEAVKLLNAHNLPVIVITNQSGVARGMFSEEDVQAIHVGMKQMFANAGAVITDFYYCPYHPTKGRGKYLLDSDCRKPKSGMFLDAAKDYELKLESCYMVGDKLSDVEAGLRLNMPGILVTTGEGKKQALKALNDPEQPQPTIVVADVLAAAAYIVSRS